MSGTIRGLPTRVGESMRFEFEVKGQSETRVLRIYWHRAFQYLRPGQRWRLPVKLDSPKGSVNRGGFDYERFLLSEGIDALGRVDQNHVAPPQYLGEALSPQDHFDRTRQVIGENLLATTPSLRIAGLKRALITGDRSRLDDATQSLLKETGTLHLLAISGLHISLVATMTAWIVYLAWPIWSLFGFRWSRRATGIIAGCLCATGYAGLAGFSTSATRALLMLLVACAVLLSRRTIQAMDGLLVAAFVIILCDPLTVLSVGFWLSFTAVALLIWTLNQRYPRRRQPIASTLLSTQVRLGIALLPLTVGLFGHIAPAGLVSNLLAIPWVSFIVMPLTFLSTVLLMLGHPSQVMSTLTDLSFAWLLESLAQIAQWSWALQYRPYPPTWIMCVGLLGGFWLFAPSGWPMRWVGAVLLTPLVFPGNTNTEAQKLQLTFFDVGSGVSVLVEVNRYKLLYGLGPQHDQVSGIVSDQLKHWPRESVDQPKLFINDVIVPRVHGEFIGHFSALRRVASIARVYSSDPKALSRHLPPNVQTYQCSRGQRLYSEDWEIELIHPGQYLPKLGATSSCVLKITRNENSILLGGALDDAGEHHLLTIYPELTAQVVLLGLSGHRRATSDEWLDRINPVYAIYSVDADDRYERPHPEILERLSKRGISTISTANCGAITLAIGDDPATIHIQTEVGMKPRFWRFGRDCPK